jgi:hypothetical protein
LWRLFWEHFKQQSRGEPTGSPSTPRDDMAIRWALQAVRTSMGRTAKIKAIDPEERIAKIAKTEAVAIVPSGRNVPNDPSVPSGRDGRKGPTDLDLLISHPESCGR